MLVPLVGVLLDEVFEKDVLGNGLNGLTGLGYDIENGAFDGDFL
jgi:hypothetical protein